MTPASQRHLASLSFSQKVDLIPAHFSLLATLFKALITGVFRQRSGTRTYRHDIISAVVKKIHYPDVRPDLPRLLQVKRVCPTICSHQRPRVSGFWVGEKSAKCVIINFHGGGFATHATHSHLHVWFDIQKHLYEHGRSIAFFFPTYTLTPHAVYPTQLIQAVEALRYVLDDEGRKPEEVILAGDSAGANLCVGILSHLMHPSPDVEPLSITSCLKGMILISPWLSFDTSYPSMARNYDRDIDPPEKLEIMARDYLSGKKSDNYTEATNAPTSWWKGGPLEGTLLVAGTDEVFVDSQRDWVDKFKSTGNHIDALFASDECHIAPFIWAEFGDRHETMQCAKIKSWLKQMLATDES